MISYDEHRRFLNRQIKLADAELCGFLQAKCGPMVPYSTDRQIQARFERGYEDGKSKIIENKGSAT